MGGDTNNSLLEPSETWTYRCVRPVSQDTVNTGAVSGQPSDGNGDPLPGVPPVTDTHQATVDVVALHQLTKSASVAQVVPNTPVTYTMVATNNFGDTPIANVVVSDPKCGAVTLITVDDNGHPLDPGESWTFRCVATITQDTVNTATVSGQPSDNAGTSLPGIPPVGDTATATVDVISAGIRITKSANPAVVVAGGQVTFTMVVENLGSNPLSSVVVTDDPMHGYLCGRRHEQQQSARTHRDVDLSLCEADWPGHGQHGVGERPAQRQHGDAAASRWLSPDTATVDVAISPAIQVAKTVSLNGVCPGVDSLSVTSGTSVTYCYVATNTGDVAMSNIVVGDDKLGSICTIAGPLAPNASQTCTATATITQDVTNVGTVSGQPSDNAGTPLPGIPPVTNTDTATVDVVSAGIRITKTATPAAVVAGGTVTFTMVVENLGTNPLSGVVVTDNQCTVTFVGGTPTATA